MRITGYKFILLLSYIIIVFFNLGTLYHLSYSDGKPTVKPRERTLEWEEAEKSLSSGGTDKTPTHSYIHINNNTQSEENNKRKKSQVKIDSLYYSPLPGTNNSWTLFDIRRGTSKKRLELIGLRLIIVDKVPVHQVIFY